MEKFAGYGFNKSHSAAYAYLAFVTGYLKAHYPLEFMSALLTSETGSTAKVVEYISECREMNIRVLAPDVLNSSEFTFTPVSPPVLSRESSSALARLKTSDRMPSIQSCRRALIAANLDRSSIFASASTWAQSIRRMIRRALLRPARWIRWKARARLIDGGDR